MIINKILSSVFINTLIIYIISKYVTWLDFTIDFNTCSLEVYLLIWAIFWFLYSILKKLIKILSLPLNILTLGLIGIVINIWFIYLFAYIVNNYVDLAKVHLWNIGQVFIMSILIYVLNLLFNKL